MGKESGLHEDFKREPEIQVGSPRAFGIVFCIVFFAIAIWPIANGETVHLWSFMIASLFLVLAIFIPDYLQPLNRIWFRFGLLLHKVVNPIVMGVLFFFTITPIAVIFRIIGKDPLNRDLDKKLETYWIERNPKELASGSMKKQF